MSTMDAQWTENFIANRKTMIRELLEGRESATKLQGLLSEPLEGDGFCLAEKLVGKILRSFNQTLIVLSSSNSVELCRVQAADHVESACSYDRMSHDFDKRVKRPASKDWRGCYNRRKMSNSWMKVSPTMEDGYTWRKYGQKQILNAKHPRCYFRCTHRHDKGCKVTKQVQKTEKNENMYHITYFGKHTCRDAWEAPESYLLTFDSKMQSKQDDNIASWQGIKSESKEDASQIDSSDNNNNISSSFDSTMWQELMDLESSRRSTVNSWMGQSDGEDVVWGIFSGASTSFLGLEFETLIESGDLDKDIA